ncbi:MAG: efflux RND transporter periplasmic adaptor subunit [Myxococcota bacterium]
MPARTSVLLLLVLGTACNRPPPAEPAAPVAAPLKREGVPRPVTTGVVEKAALHRSLEVTGTLLGEETSNLAAQVAGVVVDTPVDVGDAVARGDTLIRLDDRDARMRLSSAQAALMQARARLGLPLEGEASADAGTKPFDVEEVSEVRAARANVLATKADLDRALKLYEEGAMSVQAKDLALLKAEQANIQLDAARNGVAQAQAALAAAEVQVQMARKALSDTVIRAPFGGAVVRRNVSVGEWAAPQVPLVQLVSSKVLRLALDVPESVVSQVAVGQEVSLQVQGHPGESFPARVTRIAPSLDGQSRALRVEARVENASGKLRPGMFATARIMLPGTEEALWVPRTALSTTGGASRVFLHRGNHVEERIVVVGASRDELVEIRGDLKPGDRVVIKDVDQLTDGAPVEG